MLGWILNTPLVKVVRTQIWTLFSFKIEEIESVLTNKQRIAKKKLHSLPLISNISGNLLKLALLTLRFLYILETFLFLEF